MIKNWKDLTKNAKIVLFADFFWNLGRTLPHAILTIFLLEQGCSLVEIALLQSIFMIVAMISEFPSGVIADIFSRKIIYLASLCTLFISYLLIGFFSNYFEVLVIAYILYGLSVSLKSGTLEAEVVLEYKREGIDIKYYSIATSYIKSISAIIGGFLGSLLYNYIQQYIYFLSLFLFLISFIFAFLCSFNKTTNDTRDNEKIKTTLSNELKNGFKILRTSKCLLYILSLFAISTLFLQPFFQYWQVLFQENNIPISYFGIMYVIFQICNILGTMIYKSLEINKKYIVVILGIIPIIFSISFFYTKAIIILLPIVIVLFYIYYQHLDIIQKNKAPKQYVSSFFSLVGTIENIASIGSLFIMAICIEYFGIKEAYEIIFTSFTLLSIYLYSKLDQEIKKS